MRKATSILAVLLTLVTAAPRVHAQSSSAAQAVLDAAVREHLSSAASDRAAVTRVLQHPDVKAVAGRMGIDLGTAHEAISTLDGQQLQALTAQASQVEQALAGGQSKVVISTTAIIIGLLVLILLIVALD
jgi:hypothetical protein